MKHLNHSLRLAAAALSASALLAACGGGGDASPTASKQPAPAPEPTDTGTVPASAMASTQAFVAYLGSLPLTDASASTSDPLLIPSTLPPVSDTDEPVAL